MQLRLLTLSGQSQIFVRTLSKVLCVLATLCVWAEASSFSCARQTLEEQVDQVDTIVFAVLIAAYVYDQSFERASATFTVHELLKGRMSDEEFTVTTSADFGTGSGVRLTLGMHYLLFFNEDSMRIHVCQGSGQASVARVEKVKELLRNK